MLGRRLLLIMAVLLGLTALTTALAPRPRPTGGPTATATPAPQTTPVAPTPPAPARSAVVERTIDASAGARNPRLRVRTGDIVRLVVRGDVLDAVALEGLDEIEPVEPGSPARFEFVAEARGDHAIVLLDADRRVGLLEIDDAVKR
jgi:hypothetical protein